MFRLLFLAALAGGAYWFSTSVPIGDHSLVEHTQRIWNSEETSDLRQGVVEEATSEQTQAFVEAAAEKATPVLDGIARGIQAGAEEATR